MLSMVLHCLAVKPECQTGQAYSRTGLTIAVYRSAIGPWLERLLALAASGSGHVMLHWMQWH